MPHVKGGTVICVQVLVLQVLNTALGKPIGNTLIARVESLPLVDRVCYGCVTLAYLSSAQCKLHDC